MFPIDIDFSRLKEVLTYDPQAPMIFSSGIFLWLFAAFMVVYVLLQRKYTARILFVTLFSYYFYYKSSGTYFFLLAIVTVADFFLAQLMDRAEGYWKRKGLVVLSLSINLGLLVYFKYTNFLGGVIASLMGGEFTALDIFLPVGISFFTFQSLSYTIDVYRRDIKPLTNLLDYAFYVSFFPQLVAGPIVRYEQIAYEIDHRQENMEDFSLGMTRFVYGLGKKVLLSNYMGTIADNMFYLSGNSNLSVASAWLGGIAYTLQIYYDFSGYSDMAIGLGRMFGFHFLENFNYPYVSKSITEFWRRWHMSLSSWFRDYVYIPLGGSREGVWKTYRNTFIVWLFTGIWHGANWTFIVWGLGYFVLLCIERLGGWTKGVRYIGHIYTMAAVILLWVVFRADSLSLAGRYIAQMFGAGGSFWDNTAAECLSGSYVMLVLAVVFSCPVIRWIADKLKLQEQSRKNIAAIAAVPLFLLCIAKCMSSSYNPFIYFNF